jgi:hypothetical protein
MKFYLIDGHSIIDVFLRYENLIEDSKLLTLINPVFEELPVMLDHIKAKPGLFSTADLSTIFYKNSKQTIDLIIRRNSFLFDSFNYSHIP